jgi:hypothetical protein
MTATTRVLPKIVDDPDPELSAPEFSAPQSSAPEFSAPEFSAPEFSAPEFSAPEFSAPELGADDPSTDEHLAASPLTLVAKAHDSVRAASTAAGIEYEVALDRCAVEAVLRVAGLAIWRVRLRTIAARLRLPAADGPDEAHARNASSADRGSFSAHFSVKPLYASIPMTLDWFLPSTPRWQRITVVVAEFPPIDAPQTVEVNAVISTADDSWTVPLQFRFVAVEPERLIAAITGVVGRRPNTPFHKTPVHIDAAAEFTRCK